MERQDDLGEIVPAGRRLSPLQIGLALVVCALVAAIEVKIFDAYRQTGATATSFQSASYVTTNLANVQREAIRLQVETSQALSGTGSDWSRVQLRRALLAQQLQRLTGLMEPAEGAPESTTGDDVRSRRLAALGEIRATLAGYDALAGSRPTDERAETVQEIRALLSQLELQVKQLYDREETAFFRTMTAELRTQRQAQLLLVGLGGVIVVLGVVLMASLWRSVNRDFRHAYVLLEAEVAERTQAEVKLRLRNQELLTLHRISEIALTIESRPDTIYQQIVEEIGPTAGFPIAAIELYDEARQVMTFRGATGLSALPGMPALPFEVPVSETLSGVVACTGEAMIECGAADRPEYANEMLRRLGVQTLICVPIVAGRRVLGTLSLAHPEVVAVDERLSGWVAGLASHLAALLERQRMEEALLDSNDRLTTALEELRQAQSTMLQQERLRALGQMASGIAHDLNNALAPVVGFSELLRFVPGAMEDREKVRQYLELIHTGAKDAAETVRRLREFYRPEGVATDHAPLSLSALAQQVLALTEPKWRSDAQATGRTISVHTELDDDAWIVGSEPHLREALTNLIFNAVDALPHAGVLTVRARRQSVLDSAAAPAMAVLEVCDTGTGMSPETRQRCMEPFFTTKGERGTGLGLSMVHGIVQRHGGTLDIESWPGHGTTVSLTFPIADGPTGGGGAASTGGAAAERGTGAGKRILVVDDEPMVRRTIAELLTSDGHAVESVGDGPAALAALRTHTFDVVITDRAMPGMGGDQVAREAKALHPHLPVMMLTGYGDLMNASGERGAGVDLVLAKPVTLRALRDGLEAVA